MYLITYGRTDWFFKQYTFFNNMLNNTFIQICGLVVEA